MRAKRKKMADSHSDLFDSEVHRVAPPVHNEFFVLWSVCTVTFAILLIPGGLLLVRSLRTEPDPSSGVWSGALPFRDRYVAPERTAVRAPPRCLLPEEPANLTFDLAKQYYPKLPSSEAAPAASVSKKSLQVLCYYNKSRVTWLQGGKLWFGVASVPFSLCRYVIYGPMGLDGWSARVKTTARDVIMIEQLRSAVAYRHDGKNTSSSLLVSVRGRGEFTDLRRSVGNVRYFAANLLEWAQEHGFSGVHLDWRGFDSHLCSRPGNDAALGMIVRHLRELAALNRVPFVVALSASTPQPAELVDFYLLEGDRCARLEDTGFDALFRRLRESDTVARFSICWPVSAAVETFNRVVAAKGSRLRFVGLAQRSPFCQLESSGRFQECRIGELPLPQDQGGTGLVFRYRAADTVAVNVKNYTTIWQGLDLQVDPMCAIYSDGDFDDPLGECGDPFPLLRALLS